jgi:hypothetical protein
MPKLSDEQKRFADLFTGTWQGEETIYPSEHDAEGGIAFGSWTVEPTVDGFALLVDYSEQRGGAVGYRGHGVHTWDAQERCFFAFWFDNTGSVQRAGARATLEGDSYRYEMDGGPGKRSRMTYTFHGDDLVFRIEHSKDGGPWTPFHEGRYLRESAVEVSS